MLTTMVRRSLVGNRRITLWTLATLTTCAALVVMFTTVAVDVRAKMSRTLRAMGANAVAFPEEPAGGAANGAAARRNLKRWQELERALAAEDGDLLILTTRVGLIGGSPIAVVAADPSGLARMTPYWSLAGQRPEGPRECLVGEKVAELHDLSVGSEALVSYPDVGESARLRVAGIFESGDEDENRVFVTTHAGGTAESERALTLPPGHPDLDEAPRGIGANCAACHPGAIPPRPHPAASSGEQEPNAAAQPSTPARSYALLSVPGGEEAIARLTDRLRVSEANVAVKPLRQIVHGERAVLAKVTLLCGLAVAAVGALSALGVTAAVLARVVERRRELALLEALGATRRGVAVFLLAESAVLGALASVAGFALGTVLAQIMVRDVFGASVQPRPSAFAAGLAVALVVALAAGTAGVWRALKVLPAVALRGE